MGRSEVRGQIEGRFIALRDQVPTLALSMVVIGAVTASACTPTVRVEVPDKPIEINMNINLKIEGDVRIRMEEELDRAAEQNPDIF